jgi:hypothetical protein
MMENAWQHTHWRDLSLEQRVALLEPHCGRQIRYTLSAEAAAHLRAFGPTATPPWRVRFLLRLQPVDGNRPGIAVSTERRGMNPSSSFDELLAELAGTMECVAWEDIGELEVDLAAQPPSRS